MIDRAEIKQRAKSAFTGHYWPNVGLFAVLGVLVSGVGALGGILGGGFSSSLQLANEGDGFLIALAIFMGIMMFVCGVIGILYYIFLGGPFSVSSAAAGLYAYEGHGQSFKNFFWCFRNRRYWKCVSGMALNLLFTSLAAIAAVIPAAIISALVASAVSQPGMSDGANAAIAALIGLGIGIISSIPALIVGLGLSQTPYIIADEELSGMAAIKKSWEIMRGHKWEYFVFELSFFGWMMLTALTWGVVGFFYVNPYMSIAHAGYYRELTGGAVIIES